MDKEIVRHDITPNEAVAEFRHSWKHWVELFELRKIKGYKRGRRIYLSRESIIEYIESLYNSVHGSGVVSLLEAGV